MVTQNFVNIGSGNGLLPVGLLPHLLGTNELNYYDLLHYIQICGMYIYSGNSRWWGWGLGWSGWVGWGWGADHVLTHCTLRNMVVIINA